MSQRLVVPEVIKELHLSLLFLSNTYIAYCVVFHTERLVESILRPLPHLLLSWFFCDKTIDSSFIFLLIYLILGLFVIFFDWDRIKERQLIKIEALFKRSRNDKAKFYLFISQLSFLILKISKIIYLENHMYVIIFIRQIYL